MTSRQDKAPAPNRRWALWLGRFLLIPLTAMSGGLVFALCRTVMTGEIVAFSKGWSTSSSRFIYFAESPVWFLFFFTLAAAVTGVVIFTTFVLARLVFKKTLSNR